MTITEAPPEVTSRRRLDLAVWWAENLPAECGITVQDLEPLLAQAAGHPVDTAVVEDLACAFALPNSTVEQQDARRERIEQLVDRLDDVTLCDGCGDVIPESTTHWLCDDGSHWCHIDEHNAAHGHCHGLVES